MADIGIRTPLQFTPQGTMAVAQDAELAQCHVNQIVNVEATDESGTTRGEYEWQTDLGTYLDLARHHPIEYLKDLIETFVDSGLARWVPAATFLGVSIEAPSRLSTKSRVAWTYKNELERRTAEAES